MHMILEELLFIAGSIPLLSEEPHGSRKKGSKNAKLHHRCHLSAFPWDVDGSTVGKQSSWMELCTHAKWPDMKKSPVAPLEQKLLEVLLRSTAQAVT